MFLLTTREFGYSTVDFYVDDLKNADFWVTSEQIGVMLGYKNPEHCIKNLAELFVNIPDYRETELNLRRKGFRVVTVFNFNGLLKLCKVSGKRKAAEVVDFLYQIRRELELNAPAPKGEIQLFNYGGNQVRIFEQNGEIFFMAKDVCDILGLVNARDAIKPLPDDEKMTVGNSDGQKKRGGAQFYNFINEPGLYRLIFRSSKPEAEKFKHWVFHEVLPSLRRSSGYNINIKLTGKASDTKFYSAEEIGAQIGLDDMQVAKLASENHLLVYGFMKGWDWFFTEEGKEKILQCVRDMNSRLSLTA